MRHAVRSEHLSDEELAVAGDRDLAGSDRARIGAHLASCAECRRRLAASEQASRLLHARYPTVQNPGAWETFAHRVAAEERRRAPGPRLVPAAGLLALLLIVFVGTVQIQRATFGGGEPEPLRHVATTQPGLGPLPFAAVEPPRLPLGLVQVERSTPAADRLELLYRNAAGLAVLLAETPIGAADGPDIATGPAGNATVSVRDATVLVLRDPRPSAVAGLLWDRRGVRFELLITESPPDGLVEADAARIVEALMAAQDAAATEGGGEG